MSLHTLTFYSRYCTRYIDLLLVPMDAPYVGHWPAQKTQTRHLINCVPTVFYKESWRLEVQGVGLFVQHFFIFAPLLKTKKNEVLSLHYPPINNSPKHTRRHRHRRASEAGSTFFCPKRHSSQCTELLSYTITA